VVIDDLDVEGIAVLETEAHTPLVVDADTPLAGAITSQNLESIGRRVSQDFNRRGCIQLIQAPHGTSVNILRQSPRPFRRKQRLCFLVGEAPYHRHSINNLFMLDKLLEATA
jgi:hypothetical protein